MSANLVLKPSCDRCGSRSELYGSNCKHLTICFTCGKTMAENRAKCNFCFVTISRLIREYNVRASASTDKSLCIGRFITGLPPFSKNKSARNKWILYKEGIHGRQLTGNLRERSKNKTLVLEDETGQHQYQGQLEGAQAATYYLLMMHGKEFVAVPAGSWYNFNKIAQYKQLTLEEAEEKMNRRRRNATGYERWMMKVASSGRDEVFSNGASDNNHPKNGTSNNDETHSDNGEDVEQEATRKNRHVYSKKNIHSDDDDDYNDDATIESIYDQDDEDIEKGDDWEHEETFTDDDEAVGNNAEERDDLAHELPAPPEIKQDYVDEYDGGGGLSKSGKELKELLGRVAELNESDDDDDDENDMDDDNSISPALSPKQKDAHKDEPGENNHSKSFPSGSSQETPAKLSKAKRKHGSDYEKSHDGAPIKKIKTDESRLLSITDEHSSSTKSNVPPKSSTSVPSRIGFSPSVDAVTEDEIRAVISASALLTTQHLVARFKARLKSKEDKSAFAETLKKISKIQKINSSNYVVLRDK